MKKVFISLLSVVSLFVLASPVTAADQLADGYYYIYNTSNTDIPYRALTVINTHLCWDPLEKANPAFIFRLQPSGTEGQYYLYNLQEGSWHSASRVFRHEFRKIGDHNMTESNKITMTFTHVDGQDADIYTIKPYSGLLWCWNGKDANGRNEDTGGNAEYHSTRCAWTNSDGKYAHYHTLGQDDFSSSSTTNSIGLDKTENYFHVVPVDEDELRTAKLLAYLRNASSLYTANTIFTTGSKLINDATTNDQTINDTNIKAGQFFSTYQTAGSNFGFDKLIDEFIGNGSQDNAFQSSNIASSAPKPAFIQVDVSEDDTEKAVAGVQLELGTRGNYWGALMYPTDITVYGTNDATKAESTTQYLTKEDVASTESGWTKIADIDIPYDKISSFQSNEYLVDNRQGSSNASYLGSRVQYKNILFPDNKTYRFLRFYVNNTFVNRSSNHEFTISELQLYELSNIYATHGLQNDIETLRGLIADGNAKVQNNTSAITDGDVTALETAINNISNRRTVTIRDIGYATFVSDVNVTLPTGLTAYYITANDGTNATLTEVVSAGEVLPAGTPVILKGEPNDDPYILYVATGDAKTISETTNLLEGIAGKNQSQTDGTTYYVLSKNSEGKAALMKYNAGNTLKAGYAYLTTTSSASPAFLNISFDSATGIQSAVNSTNKSAKTYDLEGRSVKNPQKGIYIQGGKKVVIK